MLAYISLCPARAASAGVWVLRDMPAWLRARPWPATLRALRNLAKGLPAAPCPQAIVVLTPSSEVPPELQGHAVVVNWPMPDRAGACVACSTGWPSDYNLDLNGSRDAAIDAAVGLSGEEAESCFARSLVVAQAHRPGAHCAGEEERHRKAGLLEWMEPLAGGFDAVGGLDVVKAWTLKRKLAYTPAAKAYGLPTPKGMFLAGISGCGKSLIAKAVATVWATSRSCAWTSAR